MHLDGLHVRTSKKTKKCRLMVRALARSKRPPEGRVPAHAWRKGYLSRNFG